VQFIQGNYRFLHGRLKKYGRSAMTVLLFAAQTPRRKVTKPDQPFV